MQSLLSNERKCYFCGNGQWLERHHIFPASNRKKSERDGLWVYICHSCHNEPPNGVHHNKTRDLELRKEAEKAWCIENFGSEVYTVEGREKAIEAFRKEYGVNYL
jgi:hypothetical protein